MATEGVHTEALKLVSQALEALQSQTPGSVSQAIRRLELAARLLGDHDLLRWCAFHLGALLDEIPDFPGTDEKAMAEWTTTMRNVVRDKKLSLTNEELLPRLGAAGGGFHSIEFIEAMLSRLLKEKAGNDGTHYRQNLTRTINSCANAAAKKAAALYSRLAFGDIPRRQFDVIRERVDDLLLDIAPQAIEKFMSAYQMLGTGSAESASLALSSCRRVIKDVADALFPPRPTAEGERKLGDEQYINRLWAFLDENVPAGSDKDLAKAHVDYLGSFLERLYEKSSKGVHGAVKYEEAVRVVLYTYLTLGDILEFAAPGVRKALQSRGLTDLNTATLEELQRLPGVSATVAKGVVKRRARASFTSVDELRDIRGLGPKTLEKLRPHVTVVTARKTES